MRSMLSSLDFRLSLCRLPRTLLAILLLTLPWSVQAVGPRRSQVASAETEITVEANPQAPRLTQLSLKGVGSWQNQTAEPLIDHVEVHGVRRLVHWHLNLPNSSFSPNGVRLVYDADSPRLLLSWEWRARAAQGPLEHSIHIKNLSGDEVWIPLQSSFRFDWHVSLEQPLERFWVEKGAGTPSTEGTHVDGLRDGATWIGTSSTYALAGNQPREMIPYLLVDQAGGDYVGWYIGIEFSGRTRITVQRVGTSVHGEAGLNPEPGTFRTRLLPGESFETPTILLGAFSGGPDAAGNLLRRWVRQVLNNPLTIQDPSYPLLNSNTWGEGMGINETQAHRMIDQAAQLGLEMFHIDAGWFRGVGDWYPSPSKFPHGLAPIADEAHRRGLKFGIWVDWAQAGIDTESGALNVHDPKVRGWLVADIPPDWKPDAFVGRTMDLGLPAVKDYAQHEVERIVSDYHLDMLEHDGYLVAKNCSRRDHPHEAASPAQVSMVVKGNGSAMPDAENSTDVSYHAVRAYYDIYSRIRQQHPKLLFEICNDGGRMVDLGSAAHGDYFSITDTYDPLSNRRAFFDASYVFPPAMLESYVDRWPTPRIENFRYMLRSGMMGWFSLMFDPTSAGHPAGRNGIALRVPKWTPEQKAVAQGEFALYKSQLRPLIRQADLYHVSARPDGVDWDGIQYFDPKLRRGVLYAFRGSKQDEPSHRFVLRGLDSSRSYRIKFHDQGLETVLSGQTLLRRGIDVSVPTPLSSELVFFGEVSH
jgi:alpha-galactosidase